ncbi:uncharacterized protein [Chelonus insularis]|uniref:uncharacterized protein n=1 Tax=Chelonus insularis TaxID=460826 RepID=UPI001588BE79|nr:uncharacterized protein LOC118071340 [Chelonus insularis]
MSSVNLYTKYRLVVFLPIKKNELPSIDIVPRKWIYLDGRFGKLKCIFMPPPYTKENSEQLRKMVQNDDDPLDNWPSYYFQARGRADTFEEAEKLADKLIYQPYAYSTDNDESAKLKAQEDEDFLKMQKLSPKMASNMIDFAGKIDLDDLDGDKLLFSSSKKVQKKNQQHRSSDESEKCTSTDDSSDSSVTSTYKGRPGLNNKKKFSKKNEKSLSFLSERNENIRKSVDNHNLDIDEIGLTSTKNDLEKENSSSIKINAQNESSDNQYIKKLLNQVEQQQKIIIEHCQNINKTVDSNAKQINILKGYLIEIKNITEVKNAARSEPITIFDEETEEILKYCPCLTIEVFDEFEQKLKTNEDFNKKMVKKLMIKINTSQRIVQNVSTMMRVFMSREVALQLNLKPAADDKKIFVDTSFYKIIKAIIIKKFTKSEPNPIEEKVIIHSVASVLYNCKDWEGKGAERRRKGVEKRSKTKKMNKKKTDKKSTDEEEDQGDDNKYYMIYF